MANEVSLKEKIMTVAKKLSIPSITIFGSGALETTKDTSDENRLYSKSNQGISDDLENRTDALHLDSVDIIFPSQSPRDLVQSWLKDQPINSELSSLNREERRTIAKQRPNTKYDLLPPLLHSNFYFVQFDLDTTKPRFIIRHRSAACNFDGLSDQDKVHLIQVAHDFIRKLEFYDAFLSIPLGDESQVGVVYPTFYAYIFVRDVEKLITLFRWTSREQKSLSWPSIKKWRTPFWIKDINSYQSINFYIESVRNSASTYTPLEFFLMSRRKLSTNAPPNLTDSLMTDTVDDFTTHNWEAKHIIGVRSDRLATNARTLLDRWQVLHHMGQLALDWRRELDVTCWMSLTLSSQFQLPDSVCTPGLLFFPFGVPRFLWKKEEVKKPKRRRSAIGSKISLEGKRGC